MAGLYKTRVAQIAFETGHGTSDVQGALDELAAVDLVHFDAATGVLLVVERLRRWRRRTPQIARSIARDVEKIPADHPLRVRFMTMYAEQAWLRTELRPLNITGTSGEVHGIADEQGDHANIARSSPDDPGSGLRDNPSLTAEETDEEPPPRERARGRTRPAVDQHALPADFAPQLVETADQVLAGLRAIHERTCITTSTAPTLHRVGLSMAAFPAVDHMAIVHELEMWATTPGRRRTIRDLAATYRTFLKHRHEDQAGGQLDRFKRPPAPVGDRLRRLQEQAEQERNTIDGSAAA